MASVTKGYLHSVQTMGAVDGPGVRFVAFAQGCPLRCACCHNPDTWQVQTEDAPIVTTPEALVTKILRYRPFFGAEGGVTVSGGEPLLQTAFVTELFARCKREGIHTCLDTSGCFLRPDTQALLAVTDLILLDIKYTTEADYDAYVGCHYAAPLAFLAAAQSAGVPVWLRQVYIPGKNDDDANWKRLAAIAAAHSKVERTQLLAFRKLCTAKYDALGIPFPFADVPEAQLADTAKLQARLDAYIRTC